MALTTPTALIEALALGNDHDIVGTAESDRVEFKSQPYDLATSKGRRDLVSDVCSFANHRGGVVVLAVRTVKNEHMRVEVADDVRPIPNSRIDIEQILAVIRAHIHPLLQIDVRRYQRGTDTHSMPLLWSPSRITTSHSLLMRWRRRITTRTSPHAIGWPTRHGADTHWAPPARVQQLISQGLRAEAMTRTALGESGADDEAAMHLEMIASITSWRQWATIVIQAVPEAGVEITDFYGAFTRALSSWRDFRDGGFGLHLGHDRLQPRGNDLVRTDEDHFICISRSGIVTAAAVGSPELLGWAMAQQGRAGTGVVANPYPMVEFPTEVVRLAHEVVGPATFASSWSFYVAAENLLEPTPLLLRPRPTRFPSPRPVSPKVNSFGRRLRSTGDLWRDAFNVVAEVYGAGYGLGRDAIPFAREDRIDLTMMEG